MEADVAAERLAKIKAAGMDKIRFAWLGETDKGKKHYYSVQGPTFLIEYDNTQNNGNHIHSVWRDFNGDFGRDSSRALETRRALATNEGPVDLARWVLLPRIAIPDSGEHLAE